MSSLQFTSEELLAGRRLFERPWTFLLGVPSLEFLPAAGPVEIAFAGRSNVGKSSVINALVRQNGLARTSNTPGRTQELNFFVTEGVPLAIVDMPGYGFAKAPKEKVEVWTELVFAYLQGRATLARVYLLIDARHGIKPVDDKILAMLDAAAVSYQIVLTKLDKISEAARPKVIAATQALLAKHPAAFPQLIGTSSEKGIGIDELRAAIAALLAERTAQ
ncbi:MAG: ribosome biogenesis GTP-binding protein YihA/YsxC [Hyphomicrobiaceae bacterium]